MSRAKSSKHLVLMLFCGDQNKKDVTFLKTAKVNVIPQIPEPISKEEQAKYREAVKKAREAAKKAKAEARRTGKKAKIPRIPPPLQPKNKPPVVREGKQEKFLTDFVYLFITLSAKDIKSISAAIKDKKKKSPEADQASLSSRCQLAVDYNMTKLSQLIYCDWYGNVLGRKLLTNIRQLPSVVEKARTDMLKKQMRLEQSLHAKLEKIEKSLEKQRERQKFTSLTISQLEKIAGYPGKDNYVAVIKARDYLKEINNSTEKEPKQTSDASGSRSSSD